MDEQNKTGPDGTSDHVNHTEPAAPAVSTRRTFLGDVGRKTVYITPVVWTLTAQQALAGGSNPSANPSCVPNGELCFDDSDCCSNNCALGTCEE